MHRGNAWQPCQAQEGGGVSSGSPDLQQTDRAQGEGGRVLEKGLFQSGLNASPNYRQGQTAAAGQALARHLPQPPPQQPLCHCDCGARSELPAHQKHQTQKLGQQLVPCHCDAYSERHVHWPGQKLPLQMAIWGPASHSQACHLHVNLFTSVGWREQEFQQHKERERTADALETGRQDHRKPTVSGM